MRSPRRLRWLIAAAVVVVSVAGIQVLVSPLSGGGASEQAPHQEVALAPQPWADEPGQAPPQQITPEDVQRRERREARAAAAAKDIDPATGLPPASAGSNGSYEAPSPEEQKRIAVQLHSPGGSDAAERSAILLNGTALAPAGAPDPIQGAISAANLIVGQPYRWGGGHGSWRSRGYDCSGAVSYALAGGGMVQQPLTSGQFMSWGAAGPGRWLTVYANATHVYAVIGGLRWDTVGDARGSGPRWHPLDAYPSGFVARHMPGL